MKNMKRWKRLLAVGMCSAMMFSMSVGVSATENQDTEETTVAETQEEEETAPEEEAVLKGDSGVSVNENDELPQVDKEALEKAIEKAVEPESTVEVTETEEDSDELPIVEWNNNFTVSHSKGQLVGYDIELGDEWKLITEDSGKEPSNVKKYINGALMDSQAAWKYVFVLSFEPEDLAEPLEITYEIDKLEHYSNGKVDGIAKNVRISYKTEVEENGGKPYILPTVLDYDGTQDLVFRFKNGTGDHAIKDIQKVIFYPDDGLSFWGDFTYDVDAGTVTVKHSLVNNMMNSPYFINLRDKIKSFQVYMEYTDKSGIQYQGSPDTALWKVNYVANKWTSNGEKPEIIGTSYEFDGTQDMVFNFKNGTGDNAIVSVEQILFNIKEQNNADENGGYLACFYIGNYGVSYNYDIEKGQITGSPHKNGTSAMMAEQFIKGAAMAGHEIYRFDAAFKKVHTCIGCDKCGCGKNPCVFQDDMAELYHSLVETEVVVYVSPLYYHNISAQLKIAIDRYHGIDDLIRGANKKVLTIITAAYPEDWVFDGVKATIKTTTRYLGWKDCGGIFAYGCYQKSDIEKTDYPKQAFELGFNLERVVK